ncbi:MAG: lipase family protein [Methylovirgula sp.]|jgi:triacylglycerol lipase
MAFDPKLALLYGGFVQAAYSMYNADTANLTPEPSPDFPSGYQLIAWVHMSDYLFNATNKSNRPEFYGMVAEGIADPNSVVLAIRGTEGGKEWMDDLDAGGMTHFMVSNPGDVGLGWKQLYDTTEIIEIAEAGGKPASLKSKGSVSAQVKTLLEHRAAKNNATHMIGITGHSLGAALATLYAAENALVHRVPIQSLYTFASPRVGDIDFANTFNRLGLESWRVVNKPDWVPNLPLIGFYKHVDTEKEFDSNGKAYQSLPCNHSLTTYLHLIDPTFPLESQCRLPVA